MKEFVKICPATNEQCRNPDCKYSCKVYLSQIFIDELQVSDPYAAMNAIYNIVQDLPENAQKELLNPQKESIPVDSESIFSPKK